MYVKSEIFTKLGMGKSGFGGDYVLKNSYATGYGNFVVNKKQEKFKVDVDTHAYAPATGVISNVTDLAKLITQFSLRIKNNKIISTQSLASMVKTRIKIENDEQYGFGTQINILSGKNIVGHSGGASGFSTYVGYDQKDDIGVIILTNAHKFQATNIGLGIFDMLNRLKGEFSKYDTIEKFKNNKKYEGIYSSRWGDSLIVQVGNSFFDLGPKGSFLLKFSDILEPIDSKTYKVVSKSGYGMNGETVRFGKDKKSKKYYIDFGSSRSNQI